MTLRLISTISFLVLAGTLFSQSVDKGLILTEINNARAKGCKCGDERFKAVPALVWDEKLEQAARLHAEDMMKEDFFSHIGSNGSNPSERVTNAGFEWRMAGENIAKGKMNEVEVIQGWLNSPNHCKNIMDPGFTHVAVALSSDGLYWVQVFGTPIDGPVTYLKFN